MRALFLVAMCLSLLILSCSVSVSVGGPSEARKHNIDGVNLAKQGRYEEAIAEFDEAIRLDPEYAKGCATTL